MSCCKPIFLLVSPNHQTLLNFHIVSKNKKLAKLNNSAVTYNHSFEEAGTYKMPGFSKNEKSTNRKPLVFQKKMTYPTS